MTKRESKKTAWPGPSRDLLGHGREWGEAQAMAGNAEVTCEILVAEEARSGARRGSAEPSGDGLARASGTRPGQRRGRASGTAGIRKCRIGEGSHPGRLGREVAERRR